MGGALLWPRSQCAKSLRQRLSLNVFPPKEKQVQRELEARSHPFCAACIRRDGEIAESHARSAEDEEQFAGPEQNIQQARALKIREILTLEADFESLVRTFFNEGAHGGEVHALFAGFLAAWINGL